MKATGIICTATDDVYIECGGDGYYLFNRRYPGVGIAVSISM